MARKPTSHQQRRRREDALLETPGRKEIDSWFSWTEIGLLFEILSTALIYFHCTPEQAAQAILFSGCSFSCTLLLVFYLVTQAGVGPALKMVSSSMLLLHMLTITTSFIVFHWFTFCANYLVFAYKLLTQ